MTKMNIMLNIYIYIYLNIISNSNNLFKLTILFINWIGISLDFYYTSQDLNGLY